MSLQPKLHDRKNTDQLIKNVFTSEKRTCTYSSGHLISICHVILCSHWLSISATLFLRGSSCYDGFDEHTNLQIRRLASNWQ